MRSRVIPGSLVTMERRVPVKRLKSVDLPTLGRPTITRDGSCAVMNLSGGAIIHCTVSRRDAPMKIEYGQQDRKVRTPHNAGNGRREIIRKSKAHTEKTGV